MSPDASPRIRREYIHCPVTALELHKQSCNGYLYVLAGEDTHLRIYDAQSQRLCASVQVFDAQPIHGISLGRTDILIWGGSTVTVLSQAQFDRLLPRSQDVASQRHRHGLAQVQVLQAPDWIYHGAISPAQPDLAAIVTAHNQLLLFHLESSTADSELRHLRLGRLRSPPSKPILYSAQVRWTAEDEILIAAGTVFGEIIVWKCRVMLPDDAADAVNLLAVFTGHEGSVFGVDISPQFMTHPGTKTPLTLLASCSDDRTVRIWNISDTQPPSRTREKTLTAQTLTTDARETGFGEKSTPTTGLEVMTNQHSSKPLAMAMGHVSRIWNVRFSPHSRMYSSPDGTARGLTLYSFGEDAAVQRWHLSFKESNGCGGVVAAEARSIGVAALNQDKTFRHHSGQHIFSSALFCSSSLHKTFIATGGSDGRIHVMEDDVAVVSEPNAVSSVESHDTSESPTRFAFKECRLNGDFITPAAHHGFARRGPFHMYALPSATSIVATTASGQIFHGSMTGPEVSWAEVSVPDSIQDDLRKYQTIRSVGPDVTIIGSPNGQIYMYRADSIRPVLKMPRKTAQILLLSADSFQGLRAVCELLPGQIPIMVTSMASRQARLLLIDPQSEAVVLHESVIDLEKGFVPTAAGCCQEQLVLGSRFGSLVLYQFDETKRVFQPKARVRRPGSKDAVSSIICLPPRPGSRSRSRSPYFLTTSRDGRYRIYEIEATSATTSLSVQLLHEAMPPLGPMIESAFFTTPKYSSTRPELILCGFRGRALVVWNASRQIEIANVQCGGAHRAFSYRIDPFQPEKVCVVWTKASQTWLYSQNSVAKCAVKAGGHGREIKAVASQGDYIATGAEDTTIRVWKYNEGGEAGGEAKEGLRSVAVMEKHTAGIKCLKWASKRYLVSSSGNAELFVWRVTRLDRSAYESIAVVCEGVYPGRDRDADLRITSFDVQALGGEDDGEGCTGKDDKSEHLILSLGLSNSMFKTYRYSRSEGFTLLAKGRYTRACLTQIRHLRAEQEADGGGGCFGMHALTASTDGHIAVWKATARAAAPAEYEVVEVLRLHQSSVKCLDLGRLFPSWPVDGRRGRASPYVVVTGGDDNALGHVQLDWAGRCFRVASRSVATGSHAAAITGLRITRLQQGRQGGDEYTVEVCTASNDQRIKLWRMEMESGRRFLRQMSLLEDRYSGIADCGDVEMLNEGRRIVVVGVGVEIWRV